MPIARYLKHKKYKSIISSSVYFDDQYFLKQSDIKTEDAKEYYLKNWRTISVDPSPYFDREFYTETYQDVKNSSIPPLIHYILFGWKEMRAPSRYFDRAGFLREHPHINPEKVDPAAACIMLYGGYNWRTHPAFSKPEIEENTSPGGKLPVVAEVEAVQAAAEWQEAKEYFDQEYYLSFNKDVRDAGIDPFMHFMLHGYKEDRDPSPEFDTYFYRTSHLPRNSSQNPLLHYAFEGKQLELATRRANSFTLMPSEPAEDPLLSVCVHVHCFYPHLLGEMSGGLKNFPSGSHIVVTVCSAADAQFVQGFLRKTLPEPQLIDVIVVPNRGRDIGPFLVGSAHIWSKYDLVLHLHTKSSPHISWGNLWRDYLYDQLMGSAELINSVIAAFNDENLGVLYPDNFFLVKRHVPKNKNAAEVKSAASYLGIQTPDVDSEDFAAGSMCWFRTKALDRLVKNVTSWELFDEEANQVDGTFAHALERLLAEVPRHEGFTIKSYKSQKRHALTVPEKSIGFDTPDAVITDAWPRDTPRAARNELRNLSPLSKTYNKKSLNINWIIPSFIEGAGGHMTIFRIIHLLEKLGHHQTIWLQNAKEFPDPTTARQRIRDWYKPIGANVHVMFLPENINQLSGDVLIATDCWTAFPASQATKFKERFYFVQDLESDFHPAGSNRLIADATYDLGFAALCAGPWLEQKMQERGLWARRWDLSADQDVYFFLPKAELGPELQIALYARPYTPRRAVEIAFAAMEVLAKRGRRFKVHLFGEENLNVDFNFPYEQHGVLNHSELSQLYRDCDVGVVFSATNYSLIPLEMAACGLPVVELDCESTRAVFKNGEVTFAEATPYGVANAVETLADDPEKRSSQVRRALEFVAATSWEKSARDIEAAITERLDSLGFHSIDPAKMLAPALKRRKKASVFIPSYNAGAEFQQVLERLTSQKCDFPYDVLVIDSGSTDGTPELVGRFANKGIRLEQIPQSEFQHGRTRNLGISMTEGDYVAILTQDALPKDENWLANLIAGFGKGERVAGVTGRHQAYPEHGPFVANDMQNHFDALALLPNPIDMEIGLPSNYYPGSTTWRMLAFFYSDNNSAMARSVWKEIPYPEIEWGEDYVWASLAIKAGFQKAYVDDAIVFHSHDFPTKRLFKAAMEEGAFWMKEFGIELHGDPKAAIEAMKARDRAFALKHGIAPHILTGRLKSNETLVAGRYEGTRRQKNLA
ncbi:rhamnan synthesis F family protein [Agrobacterium pusense]|uniref:rhamnosyltransferase WsaF family glycosyltransferase n=1 Tax=Agrobacterium pusense TaxID=648995 RepID=UPI003D10186B